MSPLGWNAAAAEVARDYVRREEQRRRESPAAEGEAIVQTPYRAGVPRKQGENERLEGGVVRTWVSDLCYYERDPLIAQGAARRVCKIRTAEERLSTHLAEELEETVKPKYLGGRRELPDEADSRIRVP